LSQLLRVYTLADQTGLADQTLRVAAHLVVEKE
jgi:hypothetical protein